MANSSSPTVWRRWLALDLRRLREEAELSRSEVAKALGCALAKVGHMENAARGVQPGDLAQLLDLYAVLEERRESYHQALRDSRKRGWWERYDERTIPEWFSLYVGLEQGATQLRTFEPLVIDGLLQTPDYARGLFRRDVTSRTDEQIARLVEVRVARQAVLARDPDPLELWIVLDEAALRRVVTSPKTMAAQLHHLADQTEQRPNVTVQIIPFEAGAHVGSSGAFKLLGYGWPHDPGVAVVESRAGAAYLEAQHEIDDHALAYQHLCALALSPDQSLTKHGQTPRPGVRP